MKLVAKDIEQSITHLSTESHGDDAWLHPLARRKLTCQLLLLEQPAAMSGVEQRWELSGMTEPDLVVSIEEALKRQMAEVGTELAVAMGGFPLYKLEREGWVVGDYESEDSIHLRELIPVGLWKTMLLCLR